MPAWDLRHLGHGARPPRLLLPVGHRDVRLDDHLRFGLQAAEISAIVPVSRPIMTSWRYILPSGTISTVPFPLLSRSRIAEDGTLGGRRLLEDDLRPAVHAVTEHVLGVGEVHLHAHRPVAHVLRLGDPAHHALELAVIQASTRTMAGSPRSQYGTSRSGTGMMVRIIESMATVSIGSSAMP